MKYKIDRSKAEALHKAIYNEDYESLADAINAIYEQMFNYGAIDESDLEEWTEEVNDLRGSEDADDWDFALSNMYDAADNLGFWIAPAQEFDLDDLNEDVHNKDNLLKIFIYKTNKGNFDWQSNHISHSLAEFETKEKAIEDAKYNLKMKGYNPRDFEITYVADEGLDEGYSENKDSFIEKDIEDEEEIDKEYHDYSEDELKKMGAFGSHDKITKIFHITNIDWDVEDDLEDFGVSKEEFIKEQGLPSEFDIEVSYERDDEDFLDEIIGDAISDEYGFTHNGFAYEAKEEKEVTEGYVTKWIPEKGELVKISKIGSKDYYEPIDKYENRKSKVGNIGKITYVGSKYSAMDTVAVEFDDGNEYYYSTWEVEPYSIDESLKEDSNKVEENKNIDDLPFPEYKEKEIPLKDISEMAEKLKDRITYNTALIKERKDDLQLRKIFFKDLEKALSDDMFSYNLSESKADKYKDVEPDSKDLDFIEYAEENPADEKDNLFYDDDFNLDADKILEAMNSFKPDGSSFGKIEEVKKEEEINTPNKISIESDPNMEYDDVDDIELIED